MKNQGSLPVKSNGNLDREAAARSYEWTVAEIYMAASAFKALHRRQPTSTLTFRDYLDMMKAAGIRPALVGKGNGDYQLARYGDVGAYTVSNCRFVVSLTNQRERKQICAPETREKQRKRALDREKKTCPYCEKSTPPGMYGRWHGAKCKKALVV